MTQVLNEAGHELRVVALHPILLKLLSYLLVEDAVGIQKLLNLSRLDAQ